MVQHLTIYESIFFCLVQIYSKELEKVEEFGGFTDFLDTFVLTKGKRSTDDGEDEARRFRGKFKVRISPIFCDQL